MEHKLLWMLLLLFQITAVSASSVDCTKEEISMENIICADQELSTLYEELNSAYKRTMDEARDRKLLKQWQLEWLHRVDSCESKACIKEKFLSRTNLLNILAPVSSDTSKWNGYYELGEDEDINTSYIMIVGLKDNRLHATGLALWIGDASAGLVHTGEIEGIGTIENGKAIFDNGFCVAELYMSSQALIVENETGCGGMNVTFNGKYTRKNL